MTIKTKSSKEKMNLLSQMSFRVLFADILDLQLVLGHLLLVFERLLQQSLDLRFGQRLEAEDARAAEERRDDGKERVFCRRPDEGDGTIFDDGQQAILLRLVPAVDFVDGEDRADAERELLWNIALDGNPARRRELIRMLDGQLSGSRAPSVSASRADPDESV